MKKEERNILWFEEIDKNDISLAGGKGANLGEMTKAGFSVPSGFCVTSTAYFNFLHETKLDKKIHSILKDSDRNNSAKLQENSEEIKELIIKARMSTKIKKEIIDAYKKLSGGKKAHVAVRSSATAEDLPEASFAGQQESFMNMEGKDEVLLAVQRCWASLFTPRAIFYREEKGFKHLKLGIAVPIQRMVQSEVSGVMFTVDPLTNDASIIAIEAAYGLGDAVVSGSITPDQYLVSKNKLEIVKKTIVRQERMLASLEKTGFDSHGKPLSEEDKFKFIPVSSAYQEKQKVSDSSIVQLAKMGKEIEQHYGFPQDIEWAREKGKLYMVQTRPVTTLGGNEQQTVKEKKEEKTSITNEVVNQGLLPQALLSGLGASPGVASGPVRIIHSAKEINKVQKGDILVTEMTNPEFVPAMKRANAIVTDQGGRTSHAAIVSRELGIPCIVGTEHATKMLKSDEIITVDGAKGVVYEGEIETVRLTPEEKVKSSVANLKEFSVSSTPIKTATKIYVNLGEAKRVEEISKRYVDGVGLLRAEFMIAEIGKHPRYLIKRGQRDKFVDRLYEGLLLFAKAFDPRPVVYRTTDFKTNEYKNLIGGEQYEEEEANPMLGFRGVMRYISDPEIFQLELEAVKMVRRYHKNLWLMLPFVRVVSELTEAKKIMSEVGLYRTGSFKLWIMVEVPSTVILLEKFIGAGIDGVSIGSNDLTQLILGLDRDNPKVADLFDERNEAVLWAIERTIKICNEHGISSSICGQAPSVYPDLVQNLVEWGISSISVSPDKIEETRQMVAEAEYNLVRSR